MGANLKEVRERIKSVISTQQITKAMKMVSAAKLRRAQQAITQIRPYSNKLNAMMTNILSNLEGDAASVYGVEREKNNVVLVVVTSSRGLCGAFNTNVIKSAIHAIQNDFCDQREAGKLTIVCIGKKGFDYFKKKYADCNIVSDYVDLFADLSFENVAKASKVLMDDFLTQKSDAVFVAYSQFKNAATQINAVERFLPVQKLVQDKNSKQKRADYIFSPDKTELLDYLVPSILQTQFHKYLLDTNASEHGARMTAMDKASENANEMLNELKINYNKARQEAITKELSEIVGGAAALNG